VRKISETMKARKLDNFRVWRIRHAVKYEDISPGPDLAELIGAVLGDGHIEKFPRTERLTITGDRKDLSYQLPKWISINEEYITRFLRGLFEAEGSLSIHLPTSTYNFAFTNFNQHLLRIVEKALRELEFHPEVRHNAIRIRRKAEVAKL